MHISTSNNMGSCFVVFVACMIISTSPFAQTPADINYQGNENYQRQMENARQQQAQQAARSKDYWGAIAATVTGERKYSYTLRADTESEAKQRSLKQCAKNTRRNDCQVILTFKNICAAIAVDKNKIYTATSTSVKKVENAALSKCQSDGSLECFGWGEAMCSDYDHAD